MYNIMYGSKTTNLFWGNGVLVNVDLQQFGPKWSLDMIRKNHKVLAGRGGQN